MAKKTDYFKLFEDQAVCGVEAAEYLKQVLTNYERPRLRTDLETMHSIEHRADELNHQVLAALREDFVTPIDRDDISMLSQRLDDIVDAVEDVLMGFYMYHIEEVDETMLGMLDALQRSTINVQDALRELPRFRRASQDILPHLFKVGDAENAGDALFLDAMHDLYNPEKGYTAEQRLAIGHIYNAFETALDAVDETASAIEELIMTNL